jgi:membrane protease YdiL (CAAX protease family)
MLFLLKRRWRPALVGLAALATLGLGLRRLVPDPPPVKFSATAVWLGIATFCAVALCDGLLHGLFCLFSGRSYRERFQELAEVFRGQPNSAILTGALMAGIGEELVFRGWASAMPMLGLSAGMFGILHHVRASLWPFTLWAMWQGLLFAAALHWTGILTVTMVAHFLHDLAGFLFFRIHNRQAAARKQSYQPAP